MGLLSDALFGICDSGRTYDDLYFAMSVWGKTSAGMETIQASVMGGFAGELLFWIVVSVQFFGADPGIEKLKYMSNI